MKKRISILACLVFFSLACLSTAARIDAGDDLVVTSATSTGTEAASSTIESRVEGTATSQPRTCARVVAEDAVNLRADPSATSSILDHLRNGASVEVISQARREWWRVKSGEEIGFVRSIYLQESECVK
jgi:uncharacterized protein YgiM (DUF1202 family)